MEKNSDKGTFFSKKRVFDFNGKKIDLSGPQVMGILNLTPDSFYLPSPPLPPDPLFPLSKLERGPGGEVNAMISNGAYIIDIGAVSTRPGAAEVSVAEEKKRLIPVLREIRKKHPELIISVDTFRAEVARMAAGEGADMINDISGGTFDPEMIPAIVALDIPYIIMHIRGTPQTMQANPVYRDVVTEVFSFLIQKAAQLEEKGHGKIILDPGFGFGKTVEHNFQLLNSLEQLVREGYPVMAGLSRKSMINKVLGTRPAEALNGTTVLNTVALLKGAALLRVHDVKEAAECTRLIGMLQSDKLSI